MAGGVVAYVHRHPRPVRAGALEDLAAPLEHLGDQVLPWPAVLLVRGLDGPDVVGRADGDGVPPCRARRRGVGEGPLGDDLADRVALPALGGALRVGLVRVAVLVADGPPDELGDVRLGDHRGDAGRHHDAPDAARSLDAGDDVIARPLHIVRIVVAADVRHVRHPVAAAEHAVEAARFVEVGAVQGEPTGCVRGQGGEEADLRRVAHVAHAGPHPVPAVQQVADHPAADEPGSTRDRHRRLLRNCRHRRLLPHRPRAGPRQPRASTARRWRCAPPSRRHAGGRRGRRASRNGRPAPSR